MTRNKVELDWLLTPGARLAGGAVEILEVAFDALTPTPPTPVSAVMLRHMLDPYRPRCGEALRAGDTLIQDLRGQSGAPFDHPYHAVEILIPWAVLDAIAERADAARIDVLDAPSGVGLADATITHLIGAMLPPLRDEAYPSRLYADHLTLALATHVAHAYGRLRPGERRARGGLAARHVRQAQAMMRDNLQAGLSLEAMAEACGLSARHFARAFRESVGCTPHRWMAAARVSAAKAMIEGGLSLAEVAPACGFFDQSHLSRAFKREAGVAPAAWRRRRAA